MGSEDMLTIVLGRTKSARLCATRVGVDCCTTKRDVEAIFSWSSGVASRETRTMAT